MNNSDRLPGNLALPAKEQCGSNEAKLHSKGLPWQLKGGRLCGVKSETLYFIRRLTVGQEEEEGEEEEKGEEGEEGKEEEEEKGRRRKRRERRRRKERRKKGEEEEEEEERGETHL